MIRRAHAISYEAIFRLWRETDPSWGTSKVDVDENDEAEKEFKRMQREMTKEDLAKLLRERADEAIRNVMKVTSDVEFQRLCEESKNVDLEHSILVYR